MKQNTVFLCILTVNLNSVRVNSVEAEILKELNHHIGNHKTYRTSLQCVVDEEKDVITDNIVIIKYYVTSSVFILLCLVWIKPTHQHSLTVLSH